MKISITLFVLTVFFFPISFASTVFPGVLLSMVVADPVAFVITEAQQNGSPVPHTMDACMDYIKAQNASGQTDPMISIVCVDQSSIPTPAKKYQSLLVSQSLISFHGGYTTYNACTTAHENGSCYKFLMVHSEIQIINTMHTMLHHMMQNIQNNQPPFAD